jgi:phosphopantetheinyl transferase
MPDRTDGAAAPEAGFGPGATPWPELVPEERYRAGVRCCRCSLTATDAARAAGVLSRAEREALLRLTGPQTRRDEWLAGRVAAKAAARLHLRDTLGADVDPAAIEIVADAHGRPFAGGEALRRLGLELHVSIAHSRGTAAAVACADPALCGIGVDVEYICGNHDGLAELALSAEERPLWSLAPAGLEQEWLIRLWCAKEAVAKALGRGLLGGPWNVVARSVDLPSGMIELELAGALAAELPAYAGVRLAAHTRRAGDLACASAFVAAVV